MSYVVLARKYRPGQFSELVGQQAVVRTLNNSIRENRIHHAYLFTGSRGVGKTSIARIFSKALRCEERKEEGAWIVSCERCPSCLEIKSGHHVDVSEIDGASYNGVEAIRELRDHSQYLPSSGRYKIYIIDEVHMLTTAAFNALLKLLEEPPSHLIFLFATTEIHKIPLTILSRCQRFDFRKVTVSQIKQRLFEIAVKESILLRPEAAALIAQAAEGSMRDALSLMDQVIAYSGSEVKKEDVQESLGWIESGSVLDLLKSIFKRAPLDALRCIENADEQGLDIRVLTKRMIELLHDCLLAKLGQVPPEASDDWPVIQELSQLRSLEEIELIFQVFHSGLESLIRSPQPRFYLDVLIIKCATAEGLAYIESTSASPQESPKELDPVAQASQGTSWEGLIEHVRGSRPLLATLLEHASHHELPQGPEAVLMICYSTQEAYFREQLLSRVYQEQITKLSRDYFGLPLRLQVEIKDSGESIAAKKDRLDKERLTSLYQQATQHPILLEAKSLFGGEFSPIEVKEGSSYVALSP